MISGSGWEQLTPDQLIYIVNIIVVAIIMWVFGRIIVALIYYKASKNMSGKSIEQKIEDTIIPPDQKWWKKKV